MLEWCLFAYKCHMFERFSTPTADANHKEVLPPQEQEAYSHYLKLKESALADTAEIMQREISESLTGYDRFAAIVDLMNKLNEGPDCQQYRFVIDQLALEASAVGKTLLPHERMVGARKRPEVKMMEL